MVVTARVRVVTPQTHCPVGCKGKLEGWVKLLAGGCELFVVLIKALETWAAFHIQTLHRCQSLW